MKADPIKVLMVSTIPFSRNGQTLFITRLAGAMNPEKTRADFLTYRVDDESVAQEARAQGGTVFTAPNRLRHPLAYLCRVSRIIREGGYAVVHIHGNSCTLAIDLLAAKLGGANVRIAHCHNTRCKYPLLHRLLRIPFNRLYTHGFACGQDAGRWLFGKRPFTVVPNAIDAKRFAYDPAARKEVRKELGLGDGDFALGCAAHFSAQKNHAFLLDAFAQAAGRNPDLVLILAGDGSLRAQAEGQAQRLGIGGRVRFLGLRTDMPRLLSAMDAMVLPSLFEGFPTVALEWQCAGLPILLSDAVTRDCALMPYLNFLPLDAGAWANAMLALSALDRASSSRAGVQAVLDAGYDLGQVAKNVESDYRRFANEGEIEKLS